MLDSIMKDITGPANLIQAISALVGELQITRRHWAAYPSGHPVVQTALQKLQLSFNKLLELQTNLSIGVTRDGLLFDDDYIDKANLSCRSVAAALFERGVGALLIRQSPGVEDLTQLLRILGMKREELLDAGGVEHIWQESGCSSLELRGIRYDRFSGTEESQLEDLNIDEGTLWERFVRLLMQGDVGLGGSDQNRPEVLAASLNALFAQRLGTGSGLSSSAIRNSLAGMQAIISEKGAVTGGTDKSRAPGAAPYPVTGDQAELAAFVAALDPTLRRQILNGFCDTGISEQPMAEAFFRHLGSAMLQETYATAEQYAGAPELLKGILRKLVPQMTNAYETSSEDEELRDKVRVLLQEHRQETYIPDDYFSNLQDLLRDTKLHLIDLDTIREPLASLETGFIESKGSEILLQLVVTDPDGENTEELIKNLSDMCGYFLEMGDYGQVLKILNQAASPQVKPTLRLALRDAFSRREFMDEILSGLTIWGKPKYDQVGLLIQVIGRPFIEPLLDRLAEEETMSLRRFMMDRVLGFGEAARPALLERLTDNRWYVLRNIIVMLRTLAPGQEVDRLRPLLKHANQKVRHEILKSLLLAGDPIAQRQVLRDLDSHDREVQLSALNLIDRSTSPPELVNKLLQLLTQGGYSPVEYELKSACVQTLAELGLPEVLPELSNLLGSRSLLAFKALGRLKADIVRSLERYPAQSVVPLLEHLAKGTDEVAQLATEQLKIVRGRPV